MNVDCSTRVILLVALSLTLAGCAGLVGDDEPDIDTDELQENTLDTMEAVETASFEIEATYEIDIEGSEVTFDSSQTMDGEYDVAAEEMQMTIDTGPYSEINTYVMGETVYANTDGQWYQADLSLFGFETGEDQFDESMELVEVGDPEVTDTTTWDGHDVYVAEYDVDSELFADLYEEKRLEGSFSADQITLENGTVIQYIDTDDYYIRYSETNLTVDSPTGPLTVITEMTMRDFGEPVDIELPAAAENAIEIDEEYEEWPFEDIDGIGSGANDQASA